MAESLERVAVDLANVVDDKGRIITTLAWGDDVVVAERSTGKITVKVPALLPLDGSFAPALRTGFIRKATKKTLVPVGPSAPKVLKVDFVDVQQGDAALIESPDGKVVLVDGGENKLFARYLASRFRGSTDESPQDVDGIVVTHGDADHFAGLKDIEESERHPNPNKRLFIRPARILHNGLVKRPDKVPELEAFGATKKVSGSTIVTELVEDPRQVPRSEMNQYFKRWAKALDVFGGRGDMEMRRLQRGDDSAFDFLRSEGVQVKVLGPMTVDVGGAPGLPYLREPPDRFGRTPGPVKFKGESASHTVNGHSVILHITFGAVRFLFAGDLNEQAEEALIAAHDDGTLDLTSEVMKVPHHGSGDFSSGFLSRVSPVVSIVSSGDEDVMSEHIHPRANLMAALGRCSRPNVPDPLIFVTELAAFFQMEGYVTPQVVGGPEETKRKRRFFAFSRKAFGLVRVRTDGKRLLVYTYSGKDSMKEAYAFVMEDGLPVGTTVKKV